MNGKKSLNKWIDENGIHRCPKCKVIEVVTTAVPYSEKGYNKEVWTCTKCHYKEERIKREDETEEDKWEEVKE